MARQDLETVGGVDIDPAKAGIDLAELAEVSAPLGLACVPGLADVVADKAPDVAVVCTGSFLSDVEPQILELVEAGINIVSTCEELAYPWRHHPDESQRIHAAAQDAGVTVLGTGVNPGFVLDLLPIVASGVCLDVEWISGRRVVDASTRRGPLVAKVGAGLSVEAFREGVTAGRLGHKGFVESVAMIADALGLDIDSISDDVQPKVFDRATGSFSPGQVAGIDQTAVGSKSGQALIVLRLLMYVGAADPRDRIVLRGRPTVKLTLEGGTPGDEATVATAINSIPRVIEAQPGLVTMKDLPPAHWRSG